MWIIHKPKRVALWNKRHFGKKNGECAACLKCSVLLFVEKIYIKCNIWRVAVRPSYIQDARFLKVNKDNGFRVHNMTTLLAQKMFTDCTSPLSRQHTVHQHFSVFYPVTYSHYSIINPLNAELNPICHLLALLGAHHILHVSRVRVKPYISVTSSVCNYFPSGYL
jgi:hypothetical protein